MNVGHPNFETCFSWGSAVRSCVSDVSVLPVLTGYAFSPSSPSTTFRPLTPHAQSFADKLVEVVSMEDDYVWIHDYHLLVLPSLLRKRLFRVRCGLFLHSPFPSSEIFRTFPKRDELLRSILNVDLVGAASLFAARHLSSS